MLRIFNTRHPFFPVKWANAVTRWLLGLRSEGGSITIRNTKTPGENGGAAPSIDVNLAWAKALIATETPPPETKFATEDLVPPEEWEKDDGTGDGQAQTHKATDSEGGTAKETYYPCCGRSILCAAADHRHRSNVAPLDADVPETPYSEGGAIGTSAYAARLDHQHQYPEAGEVIAMDGAARTTVQAVLEDHADRILTNEDDISTLQSALLKLDTGSGTGTGDCACAAKWEVQDQKNKTTDESVDELLKAVGDVTVEQKGADGTTKYRVPLIALDGSGANGINGHTGDCYVTIDNDGRLGHSGNRAYTLLNTAKETQGVTKLLTDVDLNAEALEKLNALADLGLTTEQIKKLAAIADGAAALVPTDTATPESYSESGSVGTGAYAARHDHTHRPPTAGEVKMSDATTVEAAVGDAKKSVTDLAGTVSSQTESINTLATSVADALDRAEAVTVNTGTPAAPEYRVPLDKLTGSIDGHSGTCLVTIDNNGKLSHTNKSGADVELLGAAATRKNNNDGTTKLLTDGDLSQDSITKLKDLADKKDKMVTKDDIAGYVGTWVITAVTAQDSPDAILTITFKNTSTGSIITRTTYTM